MDKMMLIWSYIFSPSVLGEDVTEHPVLITEPVLAPHRTKEMVAQYFFESLGFPAICFAASPVLSLYGNGFHTGCVLDSGAGGTSTTCICEGYSLTHSSLRSNIGGKTVTETLHKYLFREGYQFGIDSSFFMLDEMKQKVCSVHETSYTPELFYEDSTITTQYTLPDNSVINVGVGRIIATELLFKPSVIGDESSPIHQMVYDSIRKTDPDVRKKLYTNVVLSGGNTLFPKMEERLVHELKLLTGGRCNIRIHSPKNRITSAFKGGSMICMLDSSSSMWISQKDYMNKRKI